MRKFDLPEALSQLKKETGVKIEVRHFKPPVTQEEKLGLKDKLLASPAKKPEDDGYFRGQGNYWPISFAITVQAPRKPGLFVKIVEGREKAVKDLGDKTPNAATATYVRLVPTRPINGNIGFTTQYRDNNVRIFKIKKNIFTEWEIAVVTRMKGSLSQYFLTVQKIYESPMYNCANQIVMPDVNGFYLWDELRHFLSGVTDVAKLPPIPKEVLAEEESPSENETLGLNQGRVKYFNLANGVGWLVTDEMGNLKAHWSRIKSLERFACLFKGQNVLINGIGHDAHSDALQAEGVMPLD